MNDDSRMFQPQLLVFAEDCRGDHVWDMNSHNVIKDLEMEYYMSSLPLKSSDLNPISPRRTLKRGRPFGWRQRDI